MPKRRAEGDGRAKSTRPPPPPPSHDEDDSDFCEIVEGPRKATVPAPNNISQQRSAAASPLAPATRRDISYHTMTSRGLHAPVNAFAGLSPPLSLVQPAAAGGFGFAPMHMPLGDLFQANPFGFRSDLLGPRENFQDGGYLLERTVPRTLASSNGGGSSGASVSSRVRVREGASAEEIKEEPEILYPTQEEMSAVGILRSHGLNMDEAVRFLRQNDHNLQAAIQQAADTVTNRGDWQLEDRVRLESENEKDRMATQRRHEDMCLAVVGDIVPRFQESLLLDKKEGCVAFRQAVHLLSKGQEGWVPALGAFREKAVKLLFLEQKTLRWYRQNISQVRGYFRQVIKRLEDFVENQPTQERATKEAAEDSGRIETPIPAEGTNGAGSDCSNQAGTIKRTEALASCVHSEIEALEKILYMLPSTAGGVPDAFLKCNDHTATLETDGFEELCHESADASRSRRSSKRPVIAIDDD